MQIYEVKAHWDAEASMWWAESDDVPGLVAESSTHAGLVEELRHLVPELLQMNRAALAVGRIAFRLVSDQIEDFCYA